jgi:hypothetical protein
MNIVVSTSPNIPVDDYTPAGISSVGVYIPSGENSEGPMWLLGSIPGWGGGIYIWYEGGVWMLISSFNTLIAQSSPCDVSVQPWEAVWPSPMVVESTCDPRFDRHAYGDECGADRFRRLRHLGYI